MAPKRQTRVVGTLVKTTRKVVQETLQVSVEGGEGNGEQNHSEETKVVEVAVEEKKAQESQTSVPPLEDSQPNEKAEEEETNKRKEESKEAPEEGTEEPPKGDEKQEKDGRGEDKEEPPEGEGEQKKEGAVVEGEEKGKKGGRGGKRRRKRYGGGGGGVEGVGGCWRRLQEVCVQGAEAGAPRDGGVVEGDGGARRHDDRHVREAGGRGGTAFQVHGKGDPFIQRDRGCGAPGAAWGARQACHL